MSEYLNPVEALPGRWLFSLHRATMYFASGDQLVIETTLSNIQANPALDDSLFTIPEE